MLQQHQGYYEIDSSSNDGSPSSGGAGVDSCPNSTPFSVKDILNMVDQGNQYLGCHIEG